MIHCKFESIHFGESGTTLKFRRRSPNYYEYMWICRFPDGRLYTINSHFPILEDDNFNDMIGHGTFNNEYENEWNRERICEVLEEYAFEHSDGLLLRQLRLYRRSETTEDCEILSKLYGRRILPRLSEKYDHDYYVRFECPNPTPLNLRDSGYQILHVPWFAMGGKVHSIWKLNPHTKEGLDAAGYKRETITPEEYLAMFDEKERES